LLKARYSGGGENPFRGGVLEKQKHRAKKKKKKRWGGGPGGGKLPRVAGGKARGGPFPFLCPTGRGVVQGGGLGPGTGNFQKTWAGVTSQA